VGQFEFRHPRDDAQHRSNGLPTPKRSRFGFAQAGGGPVMCGFAALYFLPDARLRGHDEGEDSN
jgi:hypothetical protein